MKERESVIIHLLGLVGLVSLPVLYPVIWAVTNPHRTLKFYIKYSKYAFVNGKIMEEIKCSEENQRKKK